MQLKSKNKTACAMLCIHSGQLGLMQAYFLSHFLCLACLISQLFVCQNAEDAEVTEN